MTDISPIVDATVTKAVAGLVGAAVSLRFVHGTAVERALMFLGAAASSYFGTPYVAHHINMKDAEGLVGLLLGLYSMPIVSKGYEAILLLNTSDIVSGISAWVKRKVGV